MFFGALLQSICLRNYFYLCFRTGLRLRSSCVTMVYILSLVSSHPYRYNKSLRLSTASRSQYSQGEIMNLMEVDSQVFQNITSYLQTLWSGPFQIIVSIIILFQQVFLFTLTLYLAWMVYLWWCSCYDPHDSVWSACFEANCFYSRRTHESQR